MPKEQTSPLLFNESTKHVHTFVDVQEQIAAKEGEMPKRIHLIPRGTFETLPYGKLVLDDVLFDQIIANVGLRKGIPVDTDHDGGASNAWITKLGKDELGLWAEEIEWTPLGVDRIKGKIYRFMSPEFSLNYTDPEHSTPHGCVLIAGTLTNRPLFKTLQAIAGNEARLTGTDSFMILFNQTPLIKAQENMKPELTAVLAKEVADLTAEDKALLKANVAELNDEQKTKYADELKEESTTPPVEPTKPVEKEPVSTDEKSDTVTAMETEVTIKASEKEALEVKAAEGAKAIETLNTMKANEEAGKMIAGKEDGKTKLPVTAKEPIARLLLSMNEDQKKDFSEVMNLIPDVKMFGEVGSDDAEVKGAEDFNKKVEALMASDKTLDLAAAQRKVNEENPGLYK